MRGFNCLSVRRTIGTTMIRSLGAFDLPDSRIAAIMEATFPVVELSRMMPDYFALQIARISEDQ